MLDLSQYIELDKVFAGIIGFAVFMYVLLDGFALGVGILLPLVRTRGDKASVLNSIGPFWDGNGTWLVLGGAGLLAAFPLAYATLFTALYIPIILMLLSLMLRNMSLEFRFKVEEDARNIWDVVLSISSVLSSFLQGIILGLFLHGFWIENGQLQGLTFYSVSWFSIGVGISLILGYALLGATWLVMKTTGMLRKWALNKALYASFGVFCAMCFVCIAMPFMHEHVRNFWFNDNNKAFLIIIPALTLLVYLALVRSILHCKNDSVPFFLSIGLFMLGYAGLALSIYPYMVPFCYTAKEAAASNVSLSFILLFAGPIIPMILSYVGYCYWVFRGKVS